jgi:hypothetical protein
MIRPKLNQVKDIIFGLQLSPYSSVVFFGGVVIFFLTMLAHQVNQPIGGDFNLAYTLEHQTKILEMSLNLWSSITVFGMQQITLLPTLPLQVFLYWNATIIGFENSFIVIMSVLLPLMLTGSILLGRILNIHWESFFVSLLGSALFFNYLTMGWIFALIAIAIMPLYLVAYDQASWRAPWWLFLAVVLLSLSVVQSHGLLWLIGLSVVYSLCKIKTYSCLRIQLKKFGLIIFGFLCLNIYWLLPLILTPPGYITSNDIVFDDVSVAISSRYQPLESLLGWGGIYNYQYEKIASSDVSILYWVNILVSALAIFSALFVKFSRLKLFALILTVSPLIFLLLAQNREILTLLPFGNVFRDLGRYAIIGTFGSALLLSLLFKSWDLEVSNISFEQKRLSLFYRLFRALAFVILMSTLYPLMSDRLYDWRQTDGPDLRLRQMPVNIVEAQLQIDEFLRSDGDEFKVVYYPLGGTISLEYDPKFKFAFQEIQDQGSFLSDKPGTWFVNNRNLGSSDEISGGIARAWLTEQNLNFLGKIGFKYAVIRYGMRSHFAVPSRAEWIKLEKAGLVTTVRHQKSFTIYKINSFSSELAVININKDDFAPTFRKISPSAYVVKISDVADSSKLILNQSFNLNWNLRLLNRNEFEQLSGMPESPFNGVSYFIKNPRFLFEKSLDMRHTSSLGYSNIWSIDKLKKCSPQDGCLAGDDGYFLIDFLPQKYFVQGLLFTVIIIIFGVVSLGVVRFKRQF